MSPPRPKIVKQVCSLCGLDWKDHGKAPTAETCVALLLAEARSLNAQLAVRPLARPARYVPWPVYPRAPYWPNCKSGGVWTTNTTGNTVGVGTAPYALTVESKT